MQVYKLTEWNYKIPIKVYMEDDFEDWEAIAKYPYYRIRGQKVTEEQAFNIIRRTDVSIYKHTIELSVESLRQRKNLVETIPNQIKLVNFKNNLLGQGEMAQGWVKPDGLIGRNGIATKYIDFKEIIYELADIVEAFPYLNMVIAISYWDGSNPLYWETVKEADNVTRDKKWLLEECNIGFEDNLDIAFCIQNNIIEVYDGERAKQKYLEYEALYNTDNPEQFTIGYFDYYKKAPCNKEYMKKCIDSLEFKEVEYIDKED